MNRPDGLRSGETYTADQVWDIIEDVIDSINLNDADAQRDEIHSTALDYIVDHYDIQPSEFDQIKVVLARITDVIEAMTDRIDRLEARS